MPRARNPARFSPQQFLRGEGIAKRSTPRGRCFTPKEERHGALGSPWKGSETHLLNGLSMLVCLVAGAAISATFAAASGACTGSAPIVSKRGNEENNDARFSLLVRAETRSRYGARAGELATESSAFAHGSYSHATLRVPDAAMDDSGAAAVLSSSGPDAPRPPSNVQKKRERDANAPSEPRVTRSTPRISPKGDSGSDRSNRTVDARPFPRRPRDGSRGCARRSEEARTRMTTLGKNSEKSFGGVCQQSRFFVPNS